MSEQFNYQSALAPFMNEFAALKELAGIHVLRTKWILLEIDKFYVANHIAGAEIKSEYVESWSKTRVNDAPGTLYAKYSVWSQLARFICRQGRDCYIPQMPRYNRSGKTFSPYIFTHEQIDAIMKKSDELRLYDKHMNCTLFCVPAVIRLLYSTGLRISEALSVKNEDVNMDDGYIHIRKTKNGSERIVPINDSLKTVLKQYVSYRDRMPLKNSCCPESFFFIKTDGNCCQAQTVYTWFRWLLKACNIPYIGNHQGPRVHDLRHTMAVHSLEKMTRQGMDMYACLPVISACLGHKSLSATEQYVRLTCEMYAELAEQCSPVNAFIYPKTKHSKNHEYEH
jgi:integrase